VGGQLDRLDDPVVGARDRLDVAAELGDRLVVVGVDDRARAERGVQARAARDGDRMGRVLGHRPLAERGRAHALPAVPVAAGVRSRGGRVLGAVAVQRAAERDVHHLHPAADAQHRQVALERIVDEGQLERVAVWRDGGERRVRLRAVAGRVDVAPEAEQHAVRVVERGRAGGPVLEVGQQQRHGPGRHERAAQRDAEVVAVVGEPGGDGDRGRVVAHGQLQGYGLWLTGCRSPVAKRS